MTKLMLETVISGCLTIMSAASAQTLNTTTAALNVAQSSTAPSVAPQAAPANTSVAKKPGMIRIGITIAKTNLSSRTPLIPGEFIRTAEAQLLASPNVDTVKLTAVSLEQATQEARSLGCDYILTSSVAQKASKIGLGAFGAVRALSIAANQFGVLPKDGTTAGVVTMGIAQNAATSVMREAASGVKAKSEITFEYSLQSTAGHTVLQETESAKAQADDEDVIAPMLQQAAAKIKAVVAKQN